MPAGQQLAKGAQNGRAGSSAACAITIVEIRGDKVRLGIDAPKEVPVHREEVYQAIKEREAGK